MTGDHVRRYMADGSSGDWQGYDICHKEDEEHPRRMGIRKMKDRKGKGEAKPSLDRFFDIIREYDDRDSVIAAGSMQGKDDVDNSKKGIVQGHAYTIKAVKEVKSNGQTFKLLQLRNPWVSGLSPLNSKNVSRPIQFLIAPSLATLAIRSPGQIRVGG